MVLALASVLCVQPATAAETYSRCAKAKRMELDLAEDRRTAKGRRALFQWAVKECGSFDRYQRTEAAPPTPKQRSSSRRR